MVFTISPKFLRPARKGLALNGQTKRAAAVLAASVTLAALAAGGVRLAAQIDGDRGIAPLASSQDIQVDGIAVDVSAKTGAEARLEGWKQAEKLAWKKLGGPAMPFGAIDAMVSSVVIEHEQVGPRRYVAKLGVVFDKAKAGQFVGGQGAGVPRSAPMLVIPVLYSGGVRQVFEVRNPWQRAWAEFQAAASPVDYVRPSGSGGDSLVLTAGQPGRRSRLWWRTLLSQFDAADVVIPAARLERQWPGGPVKGTFTARYGLDNTFLGSFTLTAKGEDDLPGMLDKAVERIDGLYRDALAQGKLKPDPTLNTGRAALDRAFAQLRAELMPKGDDPAVAPQPGPVVPAENVSGVAAETVSVQFATPDAAAVDAALAAVRGVPGVQGAATVSLAIGGTSVMRVTVSGGAERLAAALRGQGWKVSSGGGTLKISR
ncbi:heavy-metal-associated domain-containing protein [Novosphingobium beihaiensis]|uniref:Heavy-metal-associated domain-containing protein n=1 Tax=Novosphingobium beihaiensis TaxID=2930389 RepID=A0ABT0BLJ1_9SPHN|nr:heavy-metal-associated domain-containing protein [Novosphingobium beihaiensis]MCJ2185907.1 heavy-metal-associated domain-containing protein [Novosphingobium beihaiensis]